MYALKALALVALGGALVVPAPGAHAAPAQSIVSPPLPSAGIGGAGAFIRPAHVNGPFSAGGDLAGVGGAGAFISAVKMSGSFDASGDLAAWSPTGSIAHSFAAASPGSRVSASALTAEVAHATPFRRSRVIAIHGDWTGQAPGPAGEIEVGESHNAGLLSGTFQTLTSAFENTSANGSTILRHQDVITSARLPHRDGTGARVPDTIANDLTIVVVPDNDEFRFTFIGKWSAGTGIFEGADGYYTGDGTTVATPPGGDPAVRYYAGTIGGELRLA
jgi:hypothetical protein